MDFSPDFKNYKDAHINSDVTKAMIDLRSVTGNTMDLNIMFMRINDVKCAVVTIEGMVSTSSLSELVFRPLMEVSLDRKKAHKQFLIFLHKKVF